MTPNTTPTDTHPLDEALVLTPQHEGPADDGALRAVRLKVSDNGPGFSDKVLKRAFEPYVTTKTKGTGLGLAVVKKIADEHGARVRIANLHHDADPEGPATGAQVSLSFSRMAPAAMTASPDLLSEPPAIKEIKLPVLQRLAALHRTG